MNTAASIKPNSKALSAMTPVSPMASSRTSPSPMTSSCSTTRTMMGVVGACMRGLYRKDQVYLRAVACTFLSDSW